MMRRAESLGAGHGSIDAFVWARPGTAGAALEYAHRINSAVFGYGLAGIGYERGRSVPSWRAEIGIGARW